MTEQADAVITIGDCWNAIDTAGVQPNGRGSGSSYFNLSDGSYLKLPSRSFIDNGEASSEALTALASLGVHPTAGSPAPSTEAAPSTDAAASTDAAPATMLWGWVRQPPAAG